MKILGHTGHMGWQDSWCTDDNPASKKMYPDFQFGSKSKKWTMRLRANGPSMLLTVTRLCTTHEVASVYLRKKPSSSQVDQLSERGAVVYHLGQELMSQVPVKADTVQTEWYDKWAAGSEHIDSEVMAVTMEKSDDFDVMKISQPSGSSLIHTS